MPFMLSREKYAINDNLQEIWYMKDVQFESLPFSEFPKDTLNLIVCYFLRKITKYSIALSLCYIIKSIN